MKTVQKVILLLIIGFNISLQAQDYANLSQKDMDLYDKLYDKLDYDNIYKNGVKESLKLMAEKAPNIPQNLWDFIYTNIVFEKYKISTIDVLITLYNKEKVEKIFAINEMSKPINDTGLFVFQPTHEEAEKLYEIGNENGRDAMIQIMTLFTEHYNLDTGSICNFIYKIDKKLLSRDLERKRVITTGARKAGIYSGYQGLDMRQQTEVKWTERIVGSAYYEINIHWNKDLVPDRSLRLKVINKNTGAVVKEVHILNNGSYKLSKVELSKGTYKVFLKSGYGEKSDDFFHFVVDPENE